MPLDMNAVGFALDPVEATWTVTDTLIYALGVGAGTDELAYTTENSKGIPHAVLPTFAVVPGMGAALPGGVMDHVGTFNLAMAVHLTQRIEIHRPIPAPAVARTVHRVAGIYERSSGGLVDCESVTVDTATGEALFTTTMGLFIRGETGFGGSPLPDSGVGSLPEREPDHVHTASTRPEQALLYRLCGDRNPLHSDPAFAASVGFERPILHGLCTFGFAGRALLHTACEGDGERLRSMSGRFSKPVYPGDELLTSVWVEGPHVRFRTTTSTGAVVLDDGVAELR